MKIKEVIEKTKLTDRAIRLYIENGLVSPSITENYSGRKNIEFSDDDLVTLQNIATLRKADFSIAEIKSITESAEQCKAVLESFIKNKSEKIENDSKIVEALSPLLSTVNPDISIICEKLNAVTADKTVPKEDTKTPLWEKIEKWFFLVVGSVGIVCFISFIIYNFYLITVVHEIKYPYFAFKELHYIYIFCALPFIIPIFLFLVYAKHFKLKWRIVRTLISLLLTAVMVWGICYTYAYSSLARLEPFCMSQTDNPSHYLDVDGHLELPESFFPDEIPEYAGKNKYMWFFKKYPNYTQYFYKRGLNVDVFAQWRIPDRTPPKWMKVENPPEDEFYAEIQRMKNYKTESGNPPMEKTKCNWTLLYYADTSEDDFSQYYKYLIFAYNEDKRLVRYIYSGAGGENPGGVFSIPYYLTLDWYS